MKRLVLILAFYAPHAYAQETIILRTTPDAYADRWVENGHLWVDTGGKLLNGHGRLTTQYRRRVDAGPISCNRRPR